jgi:protein TonB
MKQENPETMRKKPVRYALCVLPLVLVCEHAIPQLSSPQDKTPAREPGLRELEERIQRDWDQYNKRPRRRFVGARTQDVRLAGYVDQCLNKVLQVAAKRPAEMGAMSGSAVLTVAIQSDGTIEKIEVNRSSGQKGLDDMLVRLVKSAAPFEPFPADLRKDTDILSVTRTFQIGKSGSRAGDP